MALKRGGQCKIGREEVMEIRRRWNAGETQGRLAREYRLSVVQIGRIVRGEVWQDVPMAVATPSQLAESFQRMQRLAAAIKGEQPPASTGPHGASLPELENPREAAADAALDSTPTAAEIKRMIAEQAVREAAERPSTAERMAEEAKQKNPDEMIKELKDE